MVQRYKMPKKYSTPRKYKGKCERCGTKTDDYYQYVDGNNISISYYAPYLCAKCAGKIK